MDWTQIYVAEVAPVVERLGAPLPLWAWVLGGAFVLAGLALLVYGSGSVRFAGVVPLFAVVFFAVMIRGDRARVDLPARYRVGVVESKQAKKAIKTDSRGYQIPYIVHSIELGTTETAHFDASGTRPVPDATLGTERLSVSETIYASLTEGDTITAVSYPGAEGSVSFTLAPDGTTVR